MVIIGRRDGTLVAEEVIADLSAARDEQTLVQRPGAVPVQPLPRERAGGGPRARGAPAGGPPTRKGSPAAVPELGRISRECSPATPDPAEVEDLIRRPEV